MRISSGFAKGMELKAPRSQGTRPTSAKIRAAVIDSLQSVIQDAAVLDLFSGTGALGLEALSRGAGRAIFVEQAREALRCLEENVEELKRRALKQGVKVGADIRASDVKLYFSLTKRAETFDLVFADPPYADAAAWLGFLLEHCKSLLKPGGFFIFEATKDLEADVARTLAANPIWSLQRSKCYGDTSILTFCYNEDSR